MTIGDTALGGLGISYKAGPSTGILTKAGTEADFWANQHRDGKDLRCDDMPTLAAVPLGNNCCSYETTPVTDGTPRRLPMYLFVRDVHRLTQTSPLLPLHRPPGPCRRPKRP
ncbi:hypothetical protein [Streptomyces sp. NPDC003857]